MSKATFSYGRFNPPTEAGHGKLIDAVKSHAEASGGKHYIFASHSQDSEKNPLSHSQKVGVMRKMFPGTNVSKEKHPNIISVMKNLEKQGHTHVTMIAGSDRVHNFHKLLNSYNGKEYNFKKIDVKSAGRRDPDAEGSEGMSASKLRGLVKAGKRKEFISHYSNKKLGAEIHDKVKKAMNESKALFLLGGPGSGKDYVINNILTHFNMVEVQMDQILNGSVKDLVESGTNLLVNAPVDYDKIALVRSTLGETYDVSYALVSVTNKVSRDRNEQRTKPMNESVRIRKWLDAEKSMSVFENIFRFENSLNLAEASQKDLTHFQMQIESFLKFMIENGYVFEKKIPQPTGDLKKACWKGYTAVGMKMKNGRKVPNCVPVKEEAEQIDESKIADKIRSHPAVDYYGGSDDDHFINLKRGYWHSGLQQRSFSNRNASTAHKELKYVEKMPKDMKEEAEQIDEAKILKMRQINSKRVNAAMKRGIAHKSSAVGGVSNKPSSTGLPQQKPKEYHLGATPSERAATNRVGVVRLKKEEAEQISEVKLSPEAKKAASGALRGSENLMYKLKAAAKKQGKNLKRDSRGVLRHTKEALEFGTTEARNTYASMTPGQGVIDTTPTLKNKTPSNKKKTPGEDYDARMGGSGGYSVGLTQTVPESVSLEEAVQYHLDNKIPFAENVFRPGSDMFFELIKEAKNLYTKGEYTPADEYEQEVLESDLGETAMYEGQSVMLDFPFLEEEKAPKHVRKLSKVEADEGEAVKVSIQKEEACCDDCDDLNEEEGSDATKGKGIGKPWKEGGGGAVYVRTGDGGVKKVRFSQSGMAKKYRDPGRLKSFMARHNCLGNKDKTSAAYWACRYPRFFSNTGQLWW